MIAIGESTADGPRTWTTGWCACALLTTVALVSLIVLPTAYFLSDWNGLIWALVAAALCFVSGFGSLVVTQACSRQLNPLIGLLASMTIRMVPALVVCMALAMNDSGRHYEPFVFSLLLYYLAVLGIETLLSVRLVQISDSESQG